MSNNKTIINTKATPRLLAPGHRACAGCGQMIAARAVLEELGPNTIIANATGCLEVTTTPYPESSWGVPWIHSLFENAAAVASGIRAALDHKTLLHPLAQKGEINPPTPPYTRGEINPPNPLYAKGGIKVVAQGGDGATFDIGFGLISGMWERGDNVLYICYDTEVYSNTGIQASGATPYGAATTTTPSGEGKNALSNGSHQRKKDMIAIALAHGLKYVAQASAAFPADIKRKVRKAMAVQGPTYIQIATPCIPGWKINTDEAVKAGKLAIQTGLYPLLEYENGQLISASKLSPAKKVEEYLKMQGRFSHLFKNDEGRVEIAAIQKIADENIGKYSL